MWGAPENIIWNSSSASLTIHGNKVTVKSNTVEELTLTATIGELYKDINLKLNTPNGIKTNTNGKVLVKEEFYTVSGW